MNTLLFWDGWHIEHADTCRLVQGRPEWVPEATYEDPVLDNLGMWPTVYRDQGDGTWRMLYPASGFPISLMGAESDDGVHWRPMDCPQIDPGDEKLAPHHLFSIPSANGGPIYHDPVARDGRPFKFPFIQRGGPVAGRARLDPNNTFHEIVAGDGVKPWMADNLMACSADGLHWEIDESSSWAVEGWHPDPPLNCFYNPLADRHVMITRPGWGDRRIAQLTSADARRWSDLQWVMQPDPTDPMGTQFYGLPVVYYEGTFVGLLWMAHFDSAERLDRFNQLWGPIDCQLAYSFDGEHWQRGMREPFIELNEPGRPGSGVIYPVSVVDTGDELRIYSSSTPDLHHQYAKTQYLPKGAVPPSAVLMHRLRRDGFMHIEPAGNVGRFITKPMVLLEGDLTVNVLAPHGAMQVQVTDLTSRPIEGFDFDAFETLQEVDELSAPLQWRGRSTSELVGRVTRLEVRLRHARLHALRGSFHFADALDVSLIDDGRGIGPLLFDF